MYQKNVNQWLKHLDFMLLDIFSMELALLTAVLWRHGLGAIWNIGVYQNMAWILLLINVSVVFFNESYKGIIRRGYLSELKAVFLHVSYIVILSLFFLYILRMAGKYSRSVFMAMWILYVLYTYLARSIRKRQLHKRGLANIGRRSLLVVTGIQIAETVLTEIRAYNYGEIRVIGAAILDEKAVGKLISGFSVVADRDTILDYIKENWVDEVFVNLPDEQKIPDELLEGCADMGVTIHLKLAKLTNLGMNQYVEQLASYTVLTNSVRMATPRQVFMKRTMDILGGVVGVVLTGIAFLVLTPVIIVCSPGPVFFSQIRVGKGGKQFKIYKFRSMYMDAEERKKELQARNTIKDGRMFKVEDDPRIIKGIGTFIRRTSIDELPQFWNVLKGDMSLVGTRPPTLDEWEQYELHHRKRLAIKPGITGLWQISGRSNIKDFEEVVKLDTKYIMDWSLGLDVRILLKTVSVLLRREGAA